MLPLRIEIEGFLTFRTRTEFDFRDSWLWAITGKNGAGKSALFDAITYALYGQYRGGSQQDERLINKKSDRMVVLFEFKVDTEVFRVERIIERKARGKGVAKSWAAYALGPADPNGTEPVLLPHTSTKADLNVWVKDTIGLPYKAFVASVLLLQGKADSFLVAPASERQHILMDLLDLQVYERLEAAAKKRRDGYSGDVKQLSRQLTELPFTGRDDVLATQKRLERLKDDLGKAEKKVGTASTVLHGAEQHAALIAELEKNADETRACDRLLSNASEIERDAAEYRRLTQALPTLRDIVVKSEAAARARTDLRSLEDSFVGLGLDALRQARDSADEAVSSYETEILGLRNEVSEMRAALATLQPQAEAGALITRLRTENDAAQRELDELQPVAAQYGAAVARQETCLAAHRSLPILRQLRAHRNEQNAARLRADELTAHLPRLQALDEEAQKSLQAKEEGQRALDAEIRGMEQAAAGLAARLGAAEDELQARRDAKDDGTCSRCGQPVDAAHIKKEIDRAAMALTRAKREYENKDRELGAARDRLKSIGVEVPALQDAVKRAQRAVQDSKTQLQAQQELRDRAERLVATSLASLDAPYVQLAADAAYPTETDLERVDEVARHLTASQAHYAETGKAQTTCDVLLKQVVERDEQLENLTAQYPGVDLESVRTRFDHERGALERREREVKAGEEELASRKRTLDAHEQSLKKATQEAEKVQRQIAEKKADAQAADESGAALVGSLGKDWASSCAMTRDELLQIETRTIALAPMIAEEAALNDARTSHSQLAATRKTLESQRDRIPLAHRIAVEVAAASVEKATADRDRIQLEVLDANTAVATKKKEFEQRTSIDRQLNEALTAQEDYKVLSREFGKEGLQAWLLASAQNDIREAANQILTNISEGWLQMSFRQQAEDLDILVNDFSSADEPLDVELISGGQRFRVAVALALAVGRYSGSASRQIRSVIIDEGFGSLDEDGRREMIDQIKTLEGTLDRVILVSHQDDFREAFANGYHLEKRDGYSRAMRRTEFADAVPTQN